jgi:hypothetical protein
VVRLLTLSYTCQVSVSFPLLLPVLTGMRYGEVASEATYAPLAYRSTWSMPAGSPTPDAVASNVPRVPRPVASGAVRNAVPVRPAPEQSCRTPVFS